MWKYTLFVLLWVGYVPIAAQTITLLDHATHKPVGWATLYSENPDAQAMTDAEGKADIRAFVGAAALEIRLLGYKSKTLSYAQVVESKFVVYLESVNFKLDEVVVSGTRWRQLSSKVPMKIIQVSEREIALQNPQTAADLLGVSGKVIVQKSQQGGGSPMIRGFATNRLLYVVDGVRMNTAIFRGGNIQNVINLDPFAISGTEVLFGPGSVIYGSDAVGGVMSFQTLQPQFGSADNLKVSGKAVLRHSTANREKTGHVDLNVGGEKWAAFNSSVEVYVEVFAADIKGKNPRRCNHAYYTFVGINETTGKPIPIPDVIPLTEIEQTRYESAPRRREVRLILSGRMKAENAKYLKSFFGSMPD